MIKDFSSPRHTLRIFTCQSFLLGASCFLILTIFASASGASTDITLFPRPAELEPAVNFWTKVYTEINDSHGFVHDSKHLDVIYEVVKIPTKSTRRVQEKAIEKIKDKYSKILRSLAKGKQLNLTAEEERVLSLWPKGVSKKKLRKAARQLRFQKGQANKFRDGLIRSGQWISYIKKTLSERGLPAEIASLPHVESSFNPAAASHAGAAGLWQFTRSTGRRFMRIDHVIDERLDPYMSTVAAVQLLERNHTTLKHWPLALTAYNHGVAGMRRAVRRLKTNSIETIIEKYKSRTFGFASRNFYPAFLAAVDIDKNPVRYFGHIQPEPSIDTTTAKAPQYFHIDTLKAAFNISIVELRRHNPSLKKSVWEGTKYVPQNFTLRIPITSLKGDPSTIFGTIPSEKRFSKQQRDKYHRVRRGDTLSTIATRYGVGLTELVNFNGLNRHRPIYPGQRIHLPRQKVSKYHAKPSIQKPIPEDGKYVVRRGDSIHRIAQRFNIDENKIVKLNPMQNQNLLQIGQILILKPTEESNNSKTLPIALKSKGKKSNIPEYDPSVSEITLLADPSDYTVSDNQTITVQASETLGHYAEWLGIKTQKIRTLNNIDLKEHVVSGEELKLNFSRVSKTTFETKRVTYHQELQETFFRKFRIRDTHIHTVRKGESMWVLAQKKYQVPVWLLGQYNPDLDLNQIINEGEQVNIPVLAKVSESNQ